MRRINKYITDAGYCSRREADRYIEQGRVTINGRRAGLGDSVGDADSVEVDGERVGHNRKRAVYLAFNKPVGVTCTTDPKDRTNIIDFLGYKERIFPVGRLDKDSEGLIILTNDGDIVNKILRAGNNNPKEYIVTVDKPITPEFLKAMGEGVRILGVVTKPCKIVQKNSTTFIIYLTQGLNRQIRRMCEVLGYRVTRLKRLQVMNISLGNLEVGRWRYLTATETQEMHVLLADSSGTEEASNEKKALSGKKQFRPKGSQSAVRRQSAPKPPLRKSQVESSQSKPASKPARESSLPSLTSARDKAPAKGGSYSQYRKRGKNSGRK